ncbi:peptide/nickel transport system substrate-binding protein [Friedmanniella endophytica]|uniref:Peptide/nickel transport system substrate-binding protein n=1 Tax=Microlunatus kandeliicorticis TaxID=1759536 RepID=A0A7W3P6S7_9ACTN|nr:ABC transporter substrate-binding protein [Microlunatus kandeliicorticis]MBA8795361.1 peptide/nickel transport system substrate-binding protein [Microlunatus kandeliicorticis]
MTEPTPGPVPTPTPITRRSLLQLVGLSTVGVAGVGAVAAGCSPAAPSNSGGNGGNGGGGGTAQFNGGWPYLQSPQGNYNVAGNPYVGIPNAILGGGIYIDLLCPPTGYYHWKEGTWELFLADSYSLDKASNTYTVKVKSGLKWSDGSALTAKDYVTTFWVQRILNSPLWDYISEVSAPDDTTFTMKMNQPAMVVERYLLRSTIIPTSVYGDYADKAQKITGDFANSSEAKSLNQDLVKFAPKEYVVSGPFQIEYSTINNTQLTLVKNSTGYAANTVKFDKILLYNGETPAVTPLVLSKDLDYGTYGFPVASTKQFEAIGYQTMKPPTYSGPAMLFNFAKLSEFGNAKARQGIACAINRAQNGTASLGPSGIGAKYMCGFSDNLVDNWLSADVKGKLDTYDYDTNKAAQLLTEAGWKKNGSSWQTPSGKTASYQLEYPSDYADWSACAKDIADQLTNFGIKIELRGVVSTQEPIDVAKGNFELAIQGWGNSTQPYPYFSFVQAFLTNNYPITQNQGGKGMDFQLKTNTSGFGEVDIQKLITASGSGLDENAVKANVEKLAQVFNELLPLLPMFERYGNCPALNGKRVKEFPPASDPIALNSLYGDNNVILWMMNGKLEPVSG